jgi:hypothetical protein
MRFRKVRWYAAGLVAFLMGIPLAAQTMADEGGEIADAALSLTTAIVDAAGSS